MMKKHIIEHINQRFKLYLLQSISEIIDMNNLQGFGKHVKNELVLKISQIHEISFLKRDT